MPPVPMPSGPAVGVPSGFASVPMPGAAAQGQQAQPKQQQAARPQQPQPVTDETRTVLDSSAPVDESAASAAPATASAPVRPEHSGRAAQSTSTTVADNAGNDATEGGKTGKSRKGLIIGIIVAVVVLIAAGVALFLTYNNEVWGGKKLPTEAELQAETGKTVTAKEVVARLKAKGLDAHTKAIFSGKPKGSFIGYDGQQAGIRVSAGSKVTVQESLGPGVPKGTLGQQATKVVDELKGMNVPVHYKQVIVNDTSKKPTGSIVATYPSDGQAVTDTDKGIYVGVATEGDGLGADIIGQSTSDAQSAAEAKGFDVKLAPRLSSKEDAGKIVATEPAAGGEIPSGSTVTLYYGVDSSGVKDAYTDSTGTLGNSALAAGTWCRADGDCITLKADDSGDNSASTHGAIAYTEGRDGTSYTNGGSYTETLISCDAVQQAYCSSTNADYLITGDTGAFELFPHISATNYWCGDTMVNANGPSSKVCINGKMVDAGDNADLYGKESGSVYRMQDLYVVVPAGADLDALESSGYFDKDALAEAKKQQAVDASRPFLLYRDPKLYDKTTSPRKSGSKFLSNPFLPYTGYGDKNTVAFKPAPSNDSAYYLVVSSDLDWDSLADASVKGAGSSDAAKSSDSSDSSKTKDAKDMSLSEVRLALNDGDFSPIAGKYCLKDNTMCVTVDKTGKAVLSGSQSYPMSPDDPKSAQLSTLTGRKDKGWQIPDDVGIELMGPDSDYRCDSEKGYDACMGGGYPEYKINRPVDMVYIPAGMSSAKYNGIANTNPDDPQVAGQGEPDSSKPFLKLLRYQMNVPPTDKNVLYKVE
ncbi:PASTA domain-containing protein [Bifidobacterium jacchi]|uniref:PASTA domain-containing protein n=1 Tax=Bifidobacterium jacchi TaxID=2490545 RepID=UPI001F4F244D|nr:PASTA domain-containing protein [Bifidobacterium jacchi]